jgi:hypothetical protein
VPDFGGWEFGAAHDVQRHRSTGMYRGYNQFGPWRGNRGEAGYMVLPALRDRGKDDAEKYLAGLERRINEALGMS